MRGHRIEPPPEMGARSARPRLTHPPVFAEQGTAQIPLAAGTYRDPVTGVMPTPRDSIPTFLRPLRPTISEARADRDRFRDMLHSAGHALHTASAATTEAAARFAQAGGHMHMHPGAQQPAVHGQHLYPQPPAGQMFGGPGHEQQFMPQAQMYPGMQAQEQVYPGMQPAHGVGHTLHPMQRMHPMQTPQPAQPMSYAMMHEGTGYSEGDAGAASLAMPTQVRSQPLQQAHNVLPMARSQLQNLPAFPAGGAMVDQHRWLQTSQRVAESTRENTLQAGPV